MTVVGGEPAHEPTPDLLSPETSRPFSTKDAFACLLLVCICTLWALTLKLPFSTLDDAYFITANLYVIKGLCWESVQWAFTTSYGDYWHPLMWLSLMLDKSLFGMVSWGFHLTNDILHILNALLVFLFFKKVWGGTWRSLLGAIIFAIHPQRIESVAWATERKDVLAGFFALLALLAYLRYVRKPRAGTYLLVCAAFFASLLTKPMLITLPALLLLLDCLILDRLKQKNLWSLIKEKIPLFLLGADGAVNTYLNGLVHGNYRGTFTNGVQNAVMNYLSYLWHFFYPAGLILFPRSQSWIPSWQLAGAEIILFGISAATWFAWRRSRPGSPALLFGWLWFLISMLPMSGLLQPGYSMRGDRFTYLPTLGLAIALLWGLAPLIPTFRRPKWALTAGCAITIILALLMINRLSLWQDNLTLLEHDLARDEDNAWLHHWAAWSAREHHLYTLQRYHNLQAAAFDPDSFFERGAPVVHFTPTTPMITAAPPK